MDSPIKIFAPTVGILLAGNSNNYGSSKLFSFSNKAIWLRYDDDDDDDDQIGKKVTFKNYFINVLYCAVRQITRMWFRC